MAKKNETYNINAMRPAILKARENGNRSIISKAMCAELGISEVYFNMYQTGMEKLFTAVCDYCRRKNSPKATAEELKTAYDAIFPLWRDLLSCGEKEKMSRDLRVTEHDISNLVSFCQRFVNDANNVNFEKDFVAKRAWAVMPLRAFTKSVETDLGIRVAGIEVLSDEQRDFLRAENKILRGWQKAERRIEDCKAMIEAYKVRMAKHPAAKEVFQELIDDLNTQIKELVNKVKGFKQKHHDLLNPPADGTDKVSDETATTETAKAPKKKAAGKTAAKKSPAAKVPGSSEPAVAKSLDGVPTDTNSKTDGEDKAA